MKNAGMRIRVEPELRDEFVRLCKHNDTPAAQVLRAFMRDFVKKKTIGHQAEISLTGNGANTLEQDEQYE
jgi:hypothetical protein